MLKRLYMVIAATMFLFVWTCVFVNTVLAVNGKSPGDSKGIERFLDVKVWRLRVTWAASLNEEQVTDQPELTSIETTILDGMLSGRVDFRLVKSKDSNSAYYQWTTVEGEKPDGDLTYRAGYDQKSKNKDTGEKTWFRIVADAGGVADGGAFLTIDSKSNTFQVHGYAVTAQGYIEQSSSKGAYGRSDMDVNIETSPDYWEGKVPESGITIDGGTRQVPSTVPLVLTGRMMNVSWTLTPWEEEDLPEVSVEPEGGFEEWIPEGNIDQQDKPGKLLTVFVRVHKKGDQVKPMKARLKFSLPNISEEKGVCSNWPGNAAKGKGLRFRQEDQNEGGVLKVIDETHAETTEEVEDARVVVGSYDYGAWGTLRVTGTHRGKSVKVRVHSKDTTDLTIPLDEDGNRIADVWEGGTALDPVDDKESVTGQEVNGDGMTVKEEYRGFVVLQDGRKVFRRMDPKRKELFVIDRSGYFDPDIWQESSGITAYMIDTGMCKKGATPEAACLVDFNAGNAKRNGKYGVVVTLVPGIYKDSDGDYPLGVVDDDSGGPVSPRHVTGFYLYLGNAVSSLGAVTSELGIAVAQPDSNEARLWDKSGLPRWMWKNALDKLMNGAFRQKLIDQLMRVTAIHEMGHACGLWGHYDLDDPAKKEGSFGDKSCPMYYTELQENQRWVIVQILLSPDAPLPAGFGQFCSEGLNCWGHLNVKDK